MDGNADKGTASFVDVGDASLYVEQTGDGPPVVLLHGGLFSQRGWDSLVKRLCVGHRVVAIDSRGHGRSSAGNGPMTYGRMAVDVVRVLDTLDLDRAHVVGHSDGGCILLHLLVDHPDRVASATLIGTPLHLDDYRPGSSDALGALLDTMRPAAIDQFGLGAHYESLSPHPERKAELADRLGATWRTQPVWSDAVLALVPSPVLVVGVDGDEFLDREVFIRTAEVFPQGEIVWVDEGAHAVPMTHPAAVAEAIASFVARHG